MTLTLSKNSLTVLKRRYLRQRGASESPKELFERVAEAVARADQLHGATKEDVRQTGNIFYDELSRLRFLPNSPTLMNAGTDIAQLSACFVLPIEDSIEDIFRQLGRMALIHKSGGGTGFSFSNLRPEGDKVRSTDGVASGPVSFMRIFDAATEVIKQGGRRRGANIAVLRFDHPDILEFINCKENKAALSNFNISVAVNDAFMEKIRSDKDYELINPRDKRVVGFESARRVFAQIVAMARKTGDPGLVFIDRFKEDNPTPLIGDIESTNPCGEQPLLPNESCNLGSINLTKFIKNSKIDWVALRTTTRHAVHFLDNVIDVNIFPDNATREMTLSNRKIGLGVMGFAEALIMQDIPYDSNIALANGQEIMRFISNTAMERSIELAKERGSFPNFQESRWQNLGYTHLRNATLTTIAPTGSISIIADTSSGIEPLFALSYERNVMNGSKLLEINKLFEDRMNRVGLLTDSLIEAIKKTGSIKDINEIPEEIRVVFVTGFDIDPVWHVRMQSTFQRNVDNAVSKTVNLPRDATADDVSGIFMKAFELRCKGITVYRYGSKADQVLQFEKSDDNGEVVVEDDYSGGCIRGVCNF